MGLSPNYPDFPHPRKSPFYGDGDGDTDVEILGDSLGIGGNSYFGDILGFNPKIPCSLGMQTGLELSIGSGIIWGRGKLKFRGFLGVNPRKSPNFGVGTEERISGIFTTLINVSPKAHLE